MPWREVYLYPWIIGSAACPLNELMCSFIINAINVWLLLVQGLACWIQFNKSSNNKIIFVISFIGYKVMWSFDQNKKRIEPKRETSLDGNKDRKKIKRTGNLLQQRSRVLPHDAKMLRKEKKRILYLLCYNTKVTSLSPMESTL